MVTVADKRKNEHKPIIYDKSGRDKPDDPLAVMEEILDYIAPCPVCERRVFDVFDAPDKPTKIRIKCPHCRSVVKIPISVCDTGN